VDKRKRQQGHHQCGQRPPQAGLSPRHPANSGGPRPSHHVVSPC
jgi:hypothetical protein